jgi:hypothetical protein
MKFYHQGRRTLGALIALKSLCRPKNDAQRHASPLNSPVEQLLVHNASQRRSAAAPDQTACGVVIYPGSSLARSQQSSAVCASPDF